MKAMYLATTLLVACTVEAPDTSVTEQHSEIDNRLAGNRLAGNRLAGNRLAGNRLAGNRLASNRLEALDTSAEMLSTADGREVYSYMVGCALEDDVTIEADVPNAPDVSPPDFNYTCKDERCTFAGGVGLAPRWADHKLNDKEKRWVSACLFARVNKYLMTESISLRGRHEALEISDMEESTYVLQEGAFYGNLFIDDPDPNVPPDWHACRGEAQATMETGGLVLRDCTEPDPANPGYTQCGFEYAGDCGDYNPDWKNKAKDEYACERYNDDAGIYQGCHEESDKNGGKGKKYREVITVYVTN